MQGSVVTHFMYGGFCSEFLIANFANILTRSVMIRFIYTVRHKTHTKIFFNIT